MRLCTYGDCRNIRKWQRLCTAHKEHLDKYGRCFPLPSDGKPKKYRGCDTPDCTGIHKGNGLCERCYRADLRRRKKEESAHAG